METGDSNNMALPLTFSNFSYQDISRVLPELGELDDCVGGDLPGQAVLPLLSLVEREELLLVENNHLNKSKEIYKKMYICNF